MPIHVPRHAIANIAREVADRQAGHPPAGPADRAHAAFPDAGRRAGTSPAGQDQAPAKDRPGQPPGSAVADDPQNGADCQPDCPADHR
jgi:hypothetical protein